MGRHDPQLRILVFHGRRQRKGGKSVDGREGLCLLLLRGCALDGRHVDIGEGVEGRRVLGVDDGIAPR